MPKELEDRRSRFCIVIADDHAPEWAASDALDLRPAPVQYSSLGGSATLLQQALHRAASVAPTSKILVTALEEYRFLWEPTLWCIRPEMRFVAEKGTNPLLNFAAAILSIARASPLNLVTVLPARCHVRHEWILRRALRQAALELPHIPERVAALGMLDIDEGVDEDYMVLGSASKRGDHVVQGMARRPTTWVARHLRRQGAVVFSGIMIGYAGAFAAHIEKKWPGIAQTLQPLSAMARAAQRECAIPLGLQDRMPSAVLKSLRWRPPAFPQRVFKVWDSGWSGLQSAQAVTRVVEYVTHRFDRLPLLNPPVAMDHGEPVTI